MIGSEGTLGLLTAVHAVMVQRPGEAKEIAAPWRWRDGVGIAADAVLGGKVSEDIGVPVESLHQAVAGVHSSLLFDRQDKAARVRAVEAVADLFGLSRELGGTISGEHGVGLVKSGYMAAGHSALELALHERLKSAFDPKGLWNPGKKAIR